MRWCRAFRADAKARRTKGLHRAVLRGLASTCGWLSKPRQAEALKVLLVAAPAPELNPAMTGWALAAFRTGKNTLQRDRAP